MYLQCTRSENWVLSPVAAESMFMLTPDNIRGRLTETPHGPGLVLDFTLELTIPLSDEDGTHFLLMLVGD